MLDRVKRSFSKNLNRTLGKRAVRDGLFDGIEVDKVAEIAAGFEDHMYQKYFKKMQHSYLRNAERIFALGLNKGPKLRILDIGSGFGYFAYAAKQFGHSVIGIDQPDPFFDKVAPVIGIERVLHTIEAFEPLPDVPGAPFDLITAFAPCFDDIRTDTQWSVPEWTYFLNDLQRFMAPGCKVHVKFNQYLVDGVIPDSHHPQPMPEDLVAWFRGLGASFSKRVMDLEDAPAALGRANLSVPPTRTAEQGS